MAEKAVYFVSWPSPWEMTLPDSQQLHTWFYWGLENTLTGGSSSHSRHLLPKLKHQKDGSQKDAGRREEESESL